MIEILPMLPEHAPQVLAIYEQGIASRNATFETETPDWPHFDAKFLPHTRLVAKEGKEVLGWGAIFLSSTRACYSGVAEVSVYVQTGHQRKGVGRELLLAMIKESEKNGIWSLLSVIHEENRASIHLHEQCGFRYIGYREKIAQLDGTWRTTVMMEKRSKVVGV